VTEPDAWDVCVEQLGRDPHCYVAEGAESRDTEFVAKDMVAL
jgi:hypothetical protein